MPVRGLGPTCSVHSCQRPVRELGQLCTRHWLALTSAQRLALQWEDIHAREGGDTEPIDSLAIAAEVAALEDLLGLPSYGSEAA